MAVPSLFCLLLDWRQNPLPARFGVEVAMGGKHITGFFLAQRPVHRFMIAHHSGRRHQKYI